VSNTGVFEGDSGTELRFDVGVPTADMILANIKVIKPGQIPVTWVATQGPGEEQVSYITLDGDIDTTGVWHLQVYIEFPSWKGYGSIAKLSVNKRL